MSRKLQKVAAIARNYGFTEAQIRWWLFQANSNGLADAGAVVRIGRSVYLDTDRFDAWLDSKATGQAGAA